MNQPFFIKKIAVLGSGVMGAQIAAHCVNAGFETRLFDLAKNPAAPNELITQAIQHLTKQTPTPLATPDTVRLLLARNYQEHLAELGECDLIIEAIAERLDWKKSLYEKITPYFTPKTILVSNTSGLGINTLALALPLEYRARFCGVHFFNPPRYMHLAELIPTENTSTQLLDDLETWLTSYLGKGVVRAKDTPNFIANRIGVFSLLSTIHHAERLGLGLDEVDALTGVLLGRPKSATFRTMDVVGLDTMQHVVQTMQDGLKNDPWHMIFKLPNWMTALIQQGQLGQKSGAGLYRKQGKLIEVYDPKLAEYRQSNAEVSPEIQQIFKLKSWPERMEALFHASDKQAKFLSACFQDLFHYCAYHLDAIAQTVRDVDQAMQWGFGWQQGPFQLWQAAHLPKVTHLIEHAIQKSETISSAQLPTWLLDLNEFYQGDRAFAPGDETYQLRRELLVYNKQLLSAEKIHPAVLFENEGIVVSVLPDDIALVSFKSKANTIGQAVLDGLEEGLTLAEGRCKGLIFHQKDAANFSSGADLRGVSELIKTGQFKALETMIHHFQQTLLRFKYSSIPVVSALRGRALGGGCELMMQSDRVVAAFESYVGLVEIGVGLLPAGGGCKEFALRASTSGDLTETSRLIRIYFEQIATAVVSTSATDAARRGFLKPSDHVMMHTDEVLYGAVQMIQLLTELNYVPPIETSFQAAGRETHAQLQAGLVNWLEGHFISEYDYFLANKIAYVLCGGDVYQGELINESWLLKLELEAFLELAENALTQARIRHLLETGKPLRN